MKRQIQAPLDAAELRRRAEAVAPSMVPDSASDDQPLSREQMMQQILYQLRVHQIELEMQNEHLRQAKAALEASQARYLDLYDLAPVGYLTLAESGLILQANHAAASLLGVARTDLPRQPITRFIFRDDQDLYYRLRQQTSRNADAQSCELRLCKPDGSPFWVQLAASAAPSEEAPSALRLVLSDMTERKQAEAKLQLAAQVFTHAREGIMITAPDGTLVEVNQAFSRITGYSREEALGQNPRLLQSGRHDPAFYQAMWHDLIEHGHWAGEVWNRRKDGALYAELLTISAVRDNQGQTVHYVGLFADITEHPRSSG